MPSRNNGRSANFGLASRRSTRRWRRCGNKSRRRSRRGSRNTQPDAPPRSKRRPMFGRPRRLRTSPRMTRRRLQQLRAGGLIPQREYERGQADALKLRAAADTQRAAIQRLEDEQRTRQSDRVARLKSLAAEIARIEAEIPSIRASIARLDYEIERRRIRAPIDGSWGRPRCCGPARSCAKAKGSARSCRTAGSPWSRSSRLRRRWAASARTARAAAPARLPVDAVRQRARDGQARRGRGSREQRPCGAGRRGSAAREYSSAARAARHRRGGGGTGHAGRARAAQRRPDAGLAARSSNETAATDPRDRSNVVDGLRSGVAQDAARRIRRPRQLRPPARGLPDRRRRQFDRPHRRDRRPTRPGRRTDDGAGRSRAAGRSPGAAGDGRRSYAERSHALRGRVAQAWPLGAVDGPGRWPPLDFVRAIPIGGLSPHAGGAGGGVARVGRDRGLFAPADAPIASDRCPPSDAKALIAKADADPAWRSLAALDAAVRMAAALVRAGPSRAAAGRCPGRGPGRSPQQSRSTTGRHARILRPRTILDDRRGAAARARRQGRRQRSFPGAVRRIVGEAQPSGSRSAPSGVRRRSGAPALLLARFSWPGEAWSSRPCCSAECSISAAA